MRAISVIICTYRRLSHLQRALTSLVDQSLPGDQYEILVVDNGCESEVEALVGRRGQTPSVRYVPEPCVGLSKARNTGLEYAEGEYVAFLDDDAVAGEVWLESITRAFEAGGANVAVAGGPVDLLWEESRPDWLDDSLLPSLGYLDYGSVPRLLGHGEWFYGLNMAFRSQALAKVGGFATGLGREGSKKHLISNEELLVQITLEESGHSRWYDPAALVRHHVARGRLDPSWFVRRYYWQGVSDVVMSRLLRQPTGSGRARRAIGEVRRLLGQPATIWALAGVALRPNSTNGLLGRCSALQRLGRVRGWLMRLGSA